MRVIVGYSLSIINYITKLENKPGLNSKKISAHKIFPPKPEKFLVRFLVQFAEQILEKKFQNLKNLLKFPENLKLVQNSGNISGFCCW